MEKSPQLLKLRLNLEIYCDKSEIQQILEQLNDLTMVYSTHEQIHAANKNIENKVEPMKYAIIDFEGFSPKLMGVLFHNSLFQFYITDKKYQKELYEVIFIVLHILQFLFLITFSESERRFISILTHKLRKSHDSADLEFLHSLEIINIQKANYESMSAGLFSVNEEILSDPLLRISNNVDILFDLGYIELIKEHNQNCLISTNILLKKRYFKLNLI